MNENVAYEYNFKIRKSRLLIDQAAKTKAQENIFLIGISFLQNYQMDVLMRGED